MKNTQGEIVFEKRGIEFFERKKNSLKSLKEEIEEIKNEKIKQCLLISIEDCENGFYLGSCLITSTIIIYAITQISKYDLKKEEIIDKKDKLIIDIIPEVLKEAKSYLSSSSVGEDISPAASLSLLCDCINIVKLLEKIEK